MNISRFQLPDILVFIADSTTSKIESIDANYDFREKKDSTRNRYFLDTLHSQVL